MSDCRQCADFEWCAEHEDCGLFKPKQKQTKADLIRSMTDEELADELLEWFACFMAVEWSKDMILDCLKEEVDE